jgi:methionine--tRNA ligase beta chain
MILVGKIIQVDDIINSEKLYYLTVDFGSEGIKKIASGIKLYYKKEDLIGVQTIFSFNLEPRALCGVVSSGMILMAKDISGVPQLIKISDGVVSGARIG